MDSGDWWIVVSYIATGLALSIFILSWIAEGITPPFAGGGPGGCFTNCESPQEPGWVFAIPFLIVGLVGWYIVLRSRREAS